MKTLVFALAYTANICYHKNNEKKGHQVNKVAAYLQSHISGDVLSGPRVREHYSRDGSVLNIMPNLIVYPRTTSDVRKVSRFAWQLAEKGHVLPITPRGNGTDTSGAAIGKGIILSTVAHMNRILELDTKQKMVRVQPGVNVRSLQETLHTHGLFLPSYPTNAEISTIGGVIANNSAGEKSLKYGAITRWVDRLEVVLANGEVIQTGKISRKEFNKKKGLATLEGAIYRAIDGINGEQYQALDAYYDAHADLARDNVGYNIAETINKDGSCDLTPLFVGSQGTLGIITEAIIKVQVYAPQTDMIVAAFDSIESMVQAADELALLDPASVEMIDKGLIEFVRNERGANILKDVFDESIGTPAAVLFAEFDDENARKRNKKARKADKVIRTLSVVSMHVSNPEQQETLRALRDSTVAVINHEKGGQAALPIIDDCIVPPARLQDLITTIYTIAANHKIELAVWGHAADANLHVYPLLDLSKLGDRQRVFKLMDDYFKAVIDMGGSIAADNNDGRLRVPYAVYQMGDELAQIQEDLKAAADPHGMLNPGVKTGTTLKQLVDLLSPDYSRAHLADYLPRS